MTINSLAADSLHGGRTISEAVRAIHERFCARLVARRRYRKMRAELRQYSATELTELGISAADVDFIAENASRR
jgi:uncharacterized protein YjiS (DUF1127 family)